MTRHGARLGIGRVLLDVRGFRLDADVPEVVNRRFAGHGVAHAVGLVERFKHLQAASDSAGCKAKTVGYFVQGQAVRCVVGETLLDDVGQTLKQRLTFGFGLRLAHGGVPSHAMAAAKTRSAPTWA